MDKPQTKEDSAQRPNTKEDKGASTSTNTEAPTTEVNVNVDAKPTQEG